jgi:hypothetical protein
MREIIGRRVLPDDTIERYVIPLRDVNLAVAETTARRAAGANGTGQSNYARDLKHMGEYDGAGRVSHRFRHRIRQSLVAAQLAQATELDSWEVRGLNAERREERKERNELRAAKHR